jgi:hypothetical protein
LTESEKITGTKKRASDQALEQRNWEQPIRKSGSTYRQEEKQIERKADRIVTVLLNYRLIILLNGKSYRSKVKDDVPKIKC